jgi:SAM-dependent methyltransferase
MTSAAEGSQGAWWRRLSTYLYLVDLLPGRRVLEIGCGVGDGAQFLADHGALRVVGVDRSMASVSEARARHRQTNLEFRCEETGSIELDDASFDCIFVPDGIEVLRRGSVLGELRRLLVPGGHLVLSGQSADRRGSPGGASFYEFRERLERMFAPVRMVAHTPFVGFSLVEFGGAQAADEAVLETQLDTSLMELAGGEPEASEYVAVCGGAPAPARGFTVVQVPEQNGIAAVASAASTRADAAAPAEAASDAILIQELRALLDSAIADRAGAQAQADQLRTEADGLRALVEELRADAGELRERLADAADLAESRPAGGPSPSEQIAEALGAHRDAVRSLEIAVEEGEAYAEELRADLEQAAAQAEGESAGRQRAETRAERLEAELRDWRTRASTAEGKLLRLANQADPVTAPSEPPDGRADGGDRAERERVRELEAELARAQRSWQEAEARLEAMRAERVRERERERERHEGNGKATRTAAAAAEANVGRDVARRLARFELELESGRSLMLQVEGGLAELERQLAHEQAEHAPSAWAAHRDQQLRELAAEVGVKDAEIMILHIGVSALRARMRELVGDVQRTARQARARSMAELVELMEQLGDRASAFEEREQPPAP